MPLSAGVRLGGRRPFSGEDVSDTLAAVLRGDPDWHALPSALPASIRSLIEGSLKKDRRDRIGDIATVLFLLNPAHAVSTASVTSQPSRQSLWRYAVVAIVGVATGAAVVAGIRLSAPISGSCRCSAIASRFRRYRHHSPTAHRCSLRMSGGSRTRPTKAARTTLLFNPFQGPAGSIRCSSP